MKLTSVIDDYAKQLANQIKTKPVMLALDV